MKKLIRVLGRLVFLLLVGLLAIVVFNTLTYPSRQIETEPAPVVAVPDAVADRLAEAVRIPTVSREGRIDTAAFLQLDTFLRESFPLVDSFLWHRRFNRFSHVFRWAGRKSALEPILLLGHLDVVPAEGDQLPLWTHDPFGGVREGGYIWGRGTLDDKGACLGILEAIEQLLEEGYEPERTIYLAFGHDEEISGLKGARAMVDYFQREKIRFAYILDEGMVIVRDAMPGLEVPFAGIGVAEKGYVTLQLEARLEEGGHSSMPPRETAIGILSKALYRLQETPLPANTEGIVGDMFSHLGPEMSLPLKAVFANRWLTDPLLKWQLAGQESANAMIRTTTAPTILDAGIKDNVLPLTARARINIRILPGESIASTVMQVEKIAGDPRIQVTVVNLDFASEPSPTSSTDGFGFNTVQKTIREVFPEAVVAPSLVIAATDARHYTGLSEQVLRFFPVALGQEDLKRIHGIDERIHEEAYKDAIRFYRRLIRNSAR